MYTIHQLAALAGVSTRTLRYYDQIGLLPPARTADNGYRLYGPEQAADLQQILMWRALGMDLKTIGPMLRAGDAQRLELLQRQLDALRAEQQRLAVLTDTLQKTIRDLKGEYDMTDVERFAGFKREKIGQNERTYGAEARRKYGDAAVDAANARLEAQTGEEWRDTQALEDAINTLLRELAPNGDPADAQGARLADLHRQWLCRHWPEGMYTKELHRSMAQLYAADERFAAFYDAVVPGGCAFLCAAIEHFCGASV